MRPTSLAFVALALATCVPATGLDPSRIDEARVLAVRMDPPQGTPGATVVRFAALIATPEGTVEQASVEWAWCLEPRLPADTTNIPSRCTAPDGRLVAIDATGIVAHAVVPPGACSIVGPTLPPAGPDAHPQRAPDPDSTGGYGVPARLFRTGTDAFDTAFARVRIECPRADVPSDVARAYALLAQPNHNPTIERVDRVDDHGVATALVPEGGDADDVVRGGDAITLALPVTPDSAEPYARISADGRSVERATEALDVSWFAAGGRFESNRTVLSGLSTRNVIHPVLFTTRGPMNRHSCNSCGNLC